MKNMKYFAFCFIILIFLTGCSEQKEPAPEVTPTPAVSESPSPTPTQEPTPTPAPTSTPAPSPVLIGSAQTELLDWADNRIHNINLSVNKINGYTLDPGTTFSFNQVVGERTAERGYKKASVIIQQETTQDFGGGVCQVSSTLYQAARAAGLAVTERHSHQKDVGYAHQGDDAAVDYGTKDMCFTNNTGGNIKIETTVGNGVVRAAIYRMP